MSRAALLVRHPVFEPSVSVIGYELQGRSPGDPGNGRTAVVAGDGLPDLEVETVTGGLPAYLTFPRERLLDGSIRALAPELTVVQPGERAGDHEMVTACRELREAGYRLAIALDDPEDPRRALVERGDLVKVDLGLGHPGAQHHLAYVARSLQARLLGTGVDSHETAQRALRLECEALQGDFFKEPALVTDRALTGSRLAHLRLLQAVNRPDIDFDEVEAIIKRDVPLSAKFLNHINSAFFGWGQRIESVRHGVVLLGFRGVRRWVSLVAVTGLREELPAELVATAVIRARFCESLTEHVDGGITPLSAFLTGIFSLLDSLLDLPLEEALAHVLLPPAVRAAILTQDGVLGSMLDLVCSYERGDWPGVDRHAAELGVVQSLLLSAYVEAISWTGVAVPGQDAEPDTPLRTD